MTAQTDLKSFIADLCSSKPTPGGGSVAALTASNGASLCAMLCNLTAGKKGYEDSWQKMSRTAETMQKAAFDFLDDIDRDVAAFENYMAALKLPKDTAEQTEKRKEALSAAALEAALAPFDVAKKAAELLPLAQYAVEHGNANATSDGKISVVLLSDAVRSALYNVMINLPFIADEKKREELKTAAKGFAAAAEQARKAILEKDEL